MALNADDLRTRFSEALSEMYRAEVPLYGELLQIVRDVDGAVLEAQGKQLEDRPLRNQLERHGAIRLGTEHELRAIKRLFALFGMHPVGYYDLTAVGFPLHGTAFRPLTARALDKNPFRVFTTVLRHDLLSPSIRETVDKILKDRNLFSPRLCEMIARAERESTMPAQEANDLIFESLKIFKWHSRSTVSMNAYARLKSEHPMVADIACFPSAHINHLTPRTLDIDLVQQEMARRGLPAKDAIEGPPPRQCPILLRQTSFKALEERVMFDDGHGQAVPGTHTARFGEVEQRGAAVTNKGRELYDQLLSFANRNAANVSGHQFDHVLYNSFRKFPDTWEELRVGGLVYFCYRVTGAAKLGVSVPQQVSLDRLLDLGLVEYEPIVYEDFLPFSAAGIFKSNLPEESNRPHIDCSSNVTELERALGCQILNEIDCYRKLQEDSLERCRAELGLEEITGVF
ncbi:DUF1338 domain protein [Aspergillus keveii]|uniref:2-oxoadipate dioxygenase/decarboxylase n=1 Tax=Aspergillus keveii TaxID=714993 RepID=A0ABR4FIZ4_9EURO